MHKLLLLGDEAIGQAAIDAGISGIYAYPGTPSTEIMEYVQKSAEAKERNIRSDWSVNEKTAMESALGMSYAGKRVIVSMKHVGLNVASDGFINSAITGVNGGLVVVAADDPSMHSSQNEQDSRFYGKFAMVPFLEPSNQQEAYDMVHYGFDLSEKYGIPVLLRITTRLAHSRAGIKRKKQIRDQNDLKLPDDLKQFILLPAIAKKRYKELVAKQAQFLDESENSQYNHYIDGKDKSLGIITCGIAHNYFLENHLDKKIHHPLLKISQYPLPEKLIRKMDEETEEFLVIEEGYPFVEEQLRGLLSKNIKVKGRMDKTIPRDGELNPNIVASAFEREVKVGEKEHKLVSIRPPELCKGCPHIDTYKGLNEAMKNKGAGKVLSDIGCYTLGALPPFESINSCVDMGASITMAIGASEAGMRPSVAVIGDSTFTHSGITGLLDAVTNKTPVTVFILDNMTVGMTGGQKSSGSGKLDQICKGLGVEEEHVKVIKPLKKYHDDNVKIMKEELEYEGVSVIIPRRECIQTLNRRMRAKHKAKLAGKTK